jgi:hypothetical protein
MEKDNQMDKLEYEVPKIVDLQIEQKNVEGIAICGNGSGNHIGCSTGAGPV